MKIKYLELPKYKNLEDIKLHFSTKLVSLLIGKNGLGKSNLLEAIAFIFSTIDLAERESEFTTNTSSDFFEFKIEYECKKHFVSFSTLFGVLTIKVKSDKASEYVSIPFNDFKRDREKYTPDYVIGYYSGENSRIKKFFSSHGKKRITNIKKIDGDRDFPALGKMFFTEDNCGELLFYTLSVFRNSKNYKEKIDQLLYNYLGIEEKSKINIAFNNPDFYKNFKSKNVDNLLTNFQDNESNVFWGITGKIDELLNLLYNNHLETNQPIAYSDSKEDTRSDVEEFIFFDELNYTSLNKSFPKYLKDPIHFFDVLHMSSELGIVYKIYGELVKNGQLLTNNYKELSEGEQQLLTVLGLILIAGRDDCLFLFDEPDTHLNPKWQRDLIEHLKEFNINDENSHIFLATHSPLIVQSASDEDDILLFKKDSNEEIDIEIFEHKNENWRIDQVLLSSLFDLESARPKSLDPFMKRRLEIIRKGNLTEADKKELEALENEMGYLPTGETILEIESQVLIKNIADLKRGSI
jgi:predicted ATPase